MMDMQQLFAETARMGASDLHILPGVPPMLRVSGKLAPITGQEKLDAAATLTLLEGVLSPQQKELLAANRELDFSIASPAGRFRGNVYYQKGTLSGAFRLIDAKIRSVEELGLPDICNTFAKLRQGFVLVTGPTGHGKSTTLAAMIQVINKTRAAHVITIEDPIEFVYPTGLSIVSQREMHEDTHSWNIALRSALREDPDVVLVGEMRDFETIQAALTIAETGHLVFATLHTNSAAQSIDRIVDVFPEVQQVQVRQQLSGVLEGIISQRLIPNTTGGRTVVAELMTATPAIRNLIREGKTHQIDNIIQTSAEFGMVLLESAIAQAVRSGKIASEVAAEYAVRPEDLARLLKTA
jgi:twitching motility protein PilT